MGFHGNPLQKNLSTQLWTHGDCYVNLSEERRKDLITLDRVEQKGTNTNYGIYHQKIIIINFNFKNWGIGKSKRKEWKRKERSEWKWTREKNICVISSSLIGETFHKV